MRRGRRLVCNRTGRVASAASTSIGRGSHHKALMQHLALGGRALLEHLALRGRALMVPLALRGALKVQLALHGALMVQMALGGARGADCM